MCPSLIELRDWKANGTLSMTLVLVQQSACLIPGIEEQLEGSLFSNVIVVPWSAVQQNDLEFALRDNVLCRFMERGIIAELRARGTAVMNRQAQSDACPPPRYVSVAVVTKLPAELRARSGKRGMDVGVGMGRQGASSSSSSSSSCR